LVTLLFLHAAPEVDLIVEGPGRFSVQTGANRSANQSAHNGAGNKYSNLPRSVQSSVACRLLVKNKASVPLRLLWVTHEGAGREFAQVNPDGSTVLNTYTQSTWVVEDQSGQIWAHTHIRDSASRRCNVVV
jgi:hypothetical protein